jgi:hypothetical protein
VVPASAQQRARLMFIDTVNGSRPIYDLGSARSWMRWRFSAYAWCAGENPRVVRREGTDIISQGSFQGRDATLRLDALHGRFMDTAVPWAVIADKVSPAVGYRPAIAPGTVGAERAGADGRRDASAAVARENELSSPARLALLLAPVSREALRGRSSSAVRRRFPGQILPR